MRKARFTAHQVITVLKSVDSYNWKAKFGGMEAHVGRLVGHADG